MQFNIFDLNAENLVSHWVLNNMEAVSAISNTPEWLNEKKTVAKVTVNGVELSFESLDKWFLEVYDRKMKKAEAQYADLDQEVQRRLEKRVKDEAEPIIDALYKLAGNLANVEDAIAPYWEKKEHEAL